VSRRRVRPYCSQANDGTGLAKYSCSGSPLILAKRRTAIDGLSAILAADVAGYSRLMGADEDTSST